MIADNFSTSRQMDKVELIQRSLRCFVNGLIGLLPVIGFPFVVTAFVYFIRLRLRHSSEWNPAEHYLDWGVRFALLGLVITLLLAALVMAVAIQQSTHTDYLWSAGGND